MQCPRCGIEVGSDRGNYNFRYGCPSCGWMHQLERDSAESAEDDEFDVSLGQWVLCWLLSIPFLLVFVIGPYLLALLWSPPFVESSLFHWIYWSIWPLYLLASYLVSAEPPSRDQGYFGMLIPPPAHYGDNLKKALFTALILLLTPGKIFVAAMLATPRYAAAEFRVRAKNRRLRREASVRGNAAAARAGRPDHSRADCTVPAAAVPPQRTNLTASELRDRKRPRVRSAGFSP